MKIVLLGDFYSQYLTNFHTANAERLAGMNYRDHADFLAGDFFGSFPSYRNHFRRIGHEADLLVPNYYALQQKWLDERGEKMRAGPETKNMVALRQVLEMKPDVFFLGSHFDYYGGFLAAVSKVTPNILTWIACPYPENLDFSHIKCILSGNTDFPKTFRSLGLKSEYLPSGFDPDILTHLKPRPEKVRLTFIGGLTSAHRIRIETLEWLIKHGLEIDSWGYLYFGRKDRLLRLFRKSPIELRHHGEAWALSMYQALADSAITLNVHIDIAKKRNTGGNMRTYEATGCGALLITDYVPEIDGHFTPGKDLVTYHTREELLERTKYYLEHPAEAEAIAKAGQKTCLERHSTALRIREFETIINRYCG